MINWLRSRYAVKNVATIHLARQPRRSYDIKRFSGTGCGVGNAQ